MAKPLRILVAGAAIAAGLAGFCAISNDIGGARHEQEIASLESTIAALQAKCAAESEESTKSGTGWEHDPLLCDPKALASDSGHLAGIQKEIAAKQTSINDERQYNPMTLPYFVALGIVVITGLPWSWYFVLRRIRELSDAIRGR
jgi:hypothetical protein